MPKEKATQLVRQHFDNAPPMRSTRPKPIPAPEEPLPVVASSPDVSNCDISFDELVQLCESSDIGSDFDAFFASVSDDEDSSPKLDHSAEEPEPTFIPAPAKKCLVSKIPLPIRCLTNNQVRTSVENVNCRPH